MLKHLFKPQWLPFRVEPLTWEQVQPSPQDRKQIKLFSKDDLIAIGKVARLLATTTRDDRESNGVIRLFNELLKIHNAENKPEQPKKEEETPQTWHSMLLG